MNHRYRLVSLAVLSMLWAGSAVRVEAIQITVKPVARAISLGQAAVTWTTDVPGDTKLEYGQDWNYGMTLYNPVPTTSHTVQVNSQPGIVFCFRASSTIGPGSTAYVGWGMVPSPLAEVLVEGDDDPVVTGTRIQITALLRDTHVPCQSVDFHISEVQSGLQTVVGTDNNGTQWMLNTDGPVLDGDGWSGYWDTTGFAEGEYDLIALMHTDMGVIQAQRRVYYDPAPPFPTITSPGRIIEVRSGTVPITATGASDSGRCDLFFHPADDPVKLDTTPLKQTDYPFDGKDGKSMCDPTTQASIFWSLMDETAKNKIRNMPTEGHSCPDGGGPDSCAIRRLVEILAQEKSTNGLGTGDLNTKAGTNRTTGALGLNWNFTRLGPCDRAELKRKAQGLQLGLGVKVIGVGVDIKFPSGGGHAMALKEMKDVKGEDGKYDVTFMDPVSGGDCKVKMAEDGSFDYPPDPPEKRQRVTIKGGGIWSVPHGGGKMPRRVASEDWTLIGTDTNPADGIYVNWDTAGLAPGIYWILAEATDALGHTGKDAVEVAISAPTSRLSDVKTQPDSMPVIVTGKVVTGVVGSNFWLEEDDRSSGIRVAQTGASTSASLSDRLSVKGFMAGSGPERQINAVEIYDISTGATLPGPLGMDNRVLGGGDFGIPPLGQYGAKDGVGLNNVGLLVTTWGRVSYVDSVYMMISDGSNSGVRVSTATLAIPLPNVGDYVSVIGISSLFMSGADRLPQILPRDSGDVK